MNRNSDKKMKKNQNKSFDRSSDKSRSFSKSSDKSFSKSAKKNTSKLNWQKQNDKRTKSGKFEQKPSNNFVKTNYQKNIYQQNEIANSSAVERKEQVKRNNRLINSSARKVAVRLQKYLADLGYGSRREIEELIRQRKIRVDGRIAQIGELVIGSEKITIDSKPVVIKPVGAKNETKVLIYHKPIGEICSRNDPEGRPSVFRKLPKLNHARWIGIGRLDFNTSGVLLFTNNGDLANKLMHPSTEIQRQYWVRVNGLVTQNKIDALLNGVMLEDGIARFDEILALKEVDEEDSINNRYFLVSLHEGRNREVRRLWEAVGCQVSRLKRTSFAGIELPRNLAAGKFKLADKRQLDYLYSLLNK